MVLSVILVLTLPRRKIVVPFLLITFLTPLGQQIYIAGTHWLVLRIMILVGCVRVFHQKLTTGGRLVPNGLGAIDWAFTLWAFYAGLAPLLLFGETEAMPLQFAFWIQAFGGYFFLRYLIRDVDDIVTAAKTFAVLALIFGLCMIVERIYWIDMFGYLGGVPVTPAVRADRIRAQASFSHPILAGCFGATLTPLFYWLWKHGKAKALGALGMMGSLVMVYLSASSTPAAAFAGGIVALFLWPIRRYMRAVRWGIVLTLAALDLIMKAPVWFIIARVNVTGSSDAYHRAMLIDNFVRHFKDWWLIGTRENGNWGFDMWDTCNGFVQGAEAGGLVAFGAFIAVIALGFSRLGKVRDLAKRNRQQQWLYWSLGAVMFAHVLAYFGVSYFDQTQMWWFSFLAMVSAAAPSLQAPPPRLEGRKSVEVLEAHAQ